MTLFGRDAQDQITNILVWGGKVTLITENHEQGNMSRLYQYF